MPWGARRVSSGSWICHWRFVLGVSGILGMTVSVRANVRTTAAAQSSLAKALQVSYRAGSVTGFLVGGLALAALCGFYGSVANLVEGMWKNGLCSEEPYR